MLVKYFSTIFGVIALFLLTAPLLIAQDGVQNLLPCATQDIKSDRLEYYQQNFKNYRFLSDEVLYIPIQIHVLGTDEGTGYPTEGYVRDAFCTLNKSFEQANIRFYYHSEINYINNTRWYDHENFSTGREMMYQNNVAGALNSYIVQTAAGACGYYTGGPDAVALAVNCLDPVNQTWAHEIGHQLTLPHTFYGWEGTTYDSSEDTPESIWFRGRDVETELIDGSNCREAADGFCDTPPDYLSYRWSCNANNPFGDFLFDPLGQNQQVDGSFIMSYSSGACRNSFSDEQIMAMRMNLQLDRWNIINNDDEIPPLSKSIEILSPQPDEEIQYDNSMVRWASVEEATAYNIQMSPFPNFSFKAVDSITTDTTFLLPKLILGRKHFIRVQPISDILICSDFSPSIGFIASDVSNIQLEGEAKIVLNYKNPISTQENLHITLAKSSDRSMYYFTLFDINGKRYLHQNHHLAQGESAEINTSRLPAGIYFLRIQTGSNTPQVRKLVIQ